MSTVAVFVFQRHKICRCVYRP